MRCSWRHFSSGWIGFRADAHPSGGAPVELLRWAAVLDLLGTQPPRRSWRTCWVGSCGRAIHPSPTCQPRPLSARRWQVGWARLSLPWWPMLMRNYTDATAAGQAVIAAQFATVLQVACNWQFLDAILLAAWWLGIGWLSAPIGLSYPAYRWHWQWLQEPGAAADVAALSLVRGCSTLRAFRVMDGVVDLGPGGLRAPNSNSSHHFPVMTRPPPSG